MVSDFSVFVWMLVLLAGLMLWGYWSLFRLKRRAVRLEGLLKCRDCCKDKFEELKILTFPSIFPLKSFMFVHRNRYSYSVQSEIHGHNTIDTKIKSEFVRLKKSQLSPKWYAVDINNGLSNELKCLPLEKFESFIKSRLLELGIYFVLMFNLVFQLCLFD